MSNYPKKGSAPTEVIDADFRAVPTPPAPSRFTQRLGLSAGLALPLLASFGGAASGWWSFKVSMVGAAAWMVVLYGAAHWASPAKARGLRGLGAGLLAVTLAVLVSGCSQQQATPEAPPKPISGIGSADPEARRAALEAYRGEARSLAAIGALADEVKKCRSENAARLREGVFKSDLRCAAFESYQSSLKTNRKPNSQFQGGSLDYAPR